MHANHSIRMQNAKKKKKSISSNNPFEFINKYGQFSKLRLKFQNRQSRLKKVEQKHNSSKQARKKKLSVKVSKVGLGFFDW